MAGTKAARCARGAVNGEHMADKHALDDICAKMQQQLDFRDPNTGRQQAYISLTRAEAMKIIHTRDNAKKILAAFEEMKQGIERQT